MKVVILLFLLISLVDSIDVFKSTKQGCPESVDIKPCSCSNSPYTYVECKHIDDAEIIRKVFENSKRYHFKEVHIEYSTMAFLPSYIFENVQIKELHLKNLTLSQLFDKPPKNLEALDTLHIENTKLNRGILWKLLEPLTHLRILNIYFNNIKIFGSDFSEHTTKNLKQITLYGTATKTIKPGVFKEFVALEKVAFDACKLSEIRRDIFPSPFNVRVLYFSHNNLKTIPDDMFTEMPYLQTVGLKGNQLTVIPASAFQGSLTNIEYIFLSGNPIICDCQLAWLIKFKPPALTGACDMPLEYRGKELKELEVANFNC